jgi:CO/xanthine dehydrogenase Mo-binding subunit
MSVEGQVEGCIQMGLGYALSEELINQGGRMLNISFLDYKIPTALDMPVSEQATIQQDDPRGPFGAKETGEGPVSPTAPAIADAVWHTTGFRCASLPITPEKILRGIGALETPGSGKSPRGAAEETPAEGCRTPIPRGTTRAP